jgi:four helix bundle protein
MRENLIQERSYSFALSAIALQKELVARREFVLARQMLKSGTSVGANVEEALAAQSRRDFLAKLSIARKEARECHYWLRLIRDSGLAPPSRIDPLVHEASALIRILTSIILSTRQRSDAEVPTSNP